MSATWMIYGANGYTGRLIARLAKERVLSPILAGRSAAPLAELSRELGLEPRVFDLNDADAAAKHLAGVSLVLHCAGPFMKTFAPMLQACMRARAHYLDITGELGVFERVHAMSGELARAGIAAIPGVGFDVVPSDCLAAQLNRELPRATKLALGFKMAGNASPGTLKTVIEGLPHGGRVRAAGKLIEVPTAHKDRVIRFNGPAESAVAIPWGDLSTAYHSTGIPDIEVYFAVAPSKIRTIRLLAPLRPIWKLQASRRLLSKLVDRYVPGDSPAQRRAGRCFLWGEAVDALGGRVEKRLKTPHAYDLTADAALRSVEKVLRGSVQPGFSTPSQAFGPDFVFELDGVERI